MLNKRLINEAKINKFYLFINIFQAIINSIFIIINAYYLALIVNSIFINKQSLTDITKYLIVFIINSLLKAFSNSIIDNNIKKSSEKVKKNIKNKLFNVILSSNPFKVKEQGSGELINILTDGLDNLIPYYTQYVPRVFSSMITPIIICISIGIKDIWTAVILIITYPLIPFFMALIGYKTQEKNEQQWEKLMVLSSHFLDMLQGLRTLKVFGRSSSQEKKIFSISENYRKSTMEVLTVAFLSALVLETAATISTAVVAVDLGLRLVYSKIDFLTAFFILVITPDFYLPLRQLGVKYHASLNGKVAIEKADTVETVLEHQKPSQCINFKWDKISKIQIRNLSFSHEDREALNNVSFEINSNEKIALVGESGSGKSTLINIITGFLRPAENTVFINGKDVNNLDIREYMKKIAIIPQFPHIFNMSIKDNIVLGNSISYEDFINICNLTKVSDFAEKFKDKYETIIGHGEDIEISGGEKQRIAFARTLVKNPEIIVLDEPTSALDPETEDTLTNIIRNYFNDKIVLLAAHRLNSIQAANTVLVMNDGFLIESGSPEELINSKGNFYDMMKMLEDTL